MQEKLNLSHQHIVTEAVAKLNYAPSEYSFANLYLFREIHHYQIVLHPYLYIKGMTRRHEPFIMPLFPVSECPQNELKLLCNGDEFFFPMPEETIRFFNPAYYSTHFLDEDSDYLFHTQKIQTYPGRHLSKKRALVKDFLNDYAARSYTINKNNVEAGIQILDEWQKENDLSPTETDYYSCKEALHLKDQLGLIGMICLIEDKPCAFILGEIIRPNTFLAHFSKGIKKYKGIYQYLFQSFALTLGPQIEWINMEADLGISALQHAKNSYLPDCRVPKYRVRPRKDL